MNKIIETMARVQTDLEANGGLKNVFFVACGGSNAAMYPAWYLLDREAVSFYAGSYNSSEFNATVPKSIGKNTLVICTSAKATPETVEALRVAKSHGAVTIGLTGQEGSLTAQTADYPIVYNYREEWFEDPKLVVTNSQSTALKIAFELLHRFDGYAHYEKAVKAFDMMPDIYHKASLEMRDYQISFALECQNDEVFNAIGSGPLFATAYVDAFCFLQEMQHRHCVPVHGGEYFHGPFETTEKSLPIIHLMGVGSTRSLDERTKRFLDKFGGRVFTIDAQKLGLDRLDKEVAEYFNTVLVHPISKQLFAELSAIRQHPMSYRRYMWKTDY